MEQIISIKLEDIPEVKLPYTIRVNDTVENIKAYAEENPLVYVMTFYTGCVENVPEWPDLYGEKWATRVLQPLWIGNVEVSFGEIVENMLDSPIMGGKHLWRMVE